MEIEILFQILDKVDCGLLLIDQSHMVMFVNDWFMQRSRRQNEVKNRNFFEAFPQFETSRLKGIIHQCLKYRLAKKVSYKLMDAHFELYAAKNKEVFADQSIYLQPVQYDGEDYCLITIKDISVHVAKENHLKQIAENLKETLDDLGEKEGHIKAIFENTSDGVFTFNSMGRIEHFNPSFQKLFFLESKDNRKLKLEDCFDDFNLTLEIIDSLVDEIDKSKSDEQDSYRLELSALSNQKQVPVELTLTYMNIKGNLIFLGVVRDITNQKEQEKKLQKQANTDYLTNLINRKHLFESLESMMVECRELYCLFIDLDGFKQVNDEYGHDAGDHILRNTSSVLVRSLNPDDLVCRYGGDEFVVVLSHIEDPNIVDRIVKRIQKNLQKSVPFKGHSLKVSSSIGISHFPKDAQASLELILNADKAMYEAKISGKNRYTWYSQHKIHEIK